MWYTAMRSGCLLALALFVATACTRSPEAQKARHLERGDRYAAREQYREAIIEYRNVLRFDVANQRAMRQLGLLHVRLGEMVQAARFLLKAEELNPEDLEVRSKLATIYVVGGNQEDGRREVAFILERDPRNVDALSLQAALASTPQDVDAALRNLEAARGTLGDPVKLQIMMGVLYLRKQDLPRAERAFQEAIAKDPKSVEAHLALADYHLGRRHSTEAEREFKTAADLAGTGSPARMRLVDFYLLSQKRDEARRLLLETTQKQPGYLPAWHRLAQISLQERKYDESLNAVQAILKKNSSDLEARFLLGRVRLARREVTEAIQEFQQVVRREPRHAPARYQLALAQLQAGNVLQAKTELKEATAISPNFADAALLQARLNINTGAIQPAIEDLERFIAREPRVLQAHVLLGSAYMAKREPVQATETFRRFATMAPKGDPRGHYLVGLGLRAQGKTVEARKEFEAALALAPGYVDPLNQLLAMAFAEKQPDAALTRAKKQVGLSPDSAGLHWLLGTVYVTRREPGPAEAAFLKAIELDPNLLDAYVRLGALYGRSGRYDEAIAKLNDAPKGNAQSVATNMLLGLVYEAKGDVAKAQQAYEKTLTLNPRFAPAANNLAGLYSDHGGDMDKALALAQLAKDVAPDDPRISDTLGWILYKRGVYQQAAALLSESAGKLPDQPVVQYHLGLALTKVGDKDGARKALAAAVNSPADFSAKDDARKALAAIR